MAQEIATKKKKRIKRISVTNLFGIFNHTIPLHLEDRITIIHGPNGFGKTMILKLLDALFSRNGQPAMAMPFDEFRVDFDDSTSFWITKESQEEIESAAMEDLLVSQGVRFCMTDQEPFIATLMFLLHNHNPIDVELIYSFRRTAKLIKTLTFPRYESFSEDLRRLLQESIQKRSAPEEEPDWLVETRKMISIHFIETQRLLNVRKDSQNPGKDGEQQPLVPAVRMYSEELAAMIRSKLAEYASLSQSLDGTFPERVFNPTLMQLQMDEKELRRQLALLEEKRLRLISTGLLDHGGTTTFELGDHVDESKKIMLSVYIEDTQKKLSIFDNLFEKIHLLTEIVNKRFLYKNIAINKERGFVFTTSKNTILPLENLSSGEQHELVLFYELLFKVAPGSLILIDEPELSVHIVCCRAYCE